MPHTDEAAGALGWWRGAWRALLAELVATALLVALGVASLLPGAGSVPLTHPALAFGCIVAGNVATFGSVSGAHMNPAVTLAALLAGRLAPAQALGYALAQTAGAALGMGALAALLPHAGPAACTAPSVSPIAAAIVEALLTAPLAMLCCALWRDHDPRRPDHAAPLKLGFTVAGLVYAGGPLTGASLNPVRSLAPALLYPSCWEHHWVYWLGPLGGAALGSLLHARVLAPAAPAPAALTPADIPLRGKGDEVVDVD